MAGKTVEGRLAEHDRQLSAIKKLILTGMRMLTRTDEQLNSLTGKVEALADDMRKLSAAQRATEKKLPGLIDALRGSNGHGKLRGA